MSESGDIAIAAKSGQRLKVLVLGGYGTFGRRLVELLSDAAALDIVIAGRSGVKAATLAGALNSTARLQSATIDRDGDIERSLASVRPDIVVDASGPFQAYGADPYRVARACLRHGIDYLDFSDASAFTAGIVELDAEARARGRFVLSAVSSAPALSGAAARHLAESMASVEGFEAGIAPSPFAGIGRNVIEAIASYAGRPLRRWRDGRMATARGLTQTRRMTIGPPGSLPLHARRFALVDVPDLAMAPEILPGLRDTWFGAGTAPQPYLVLLVLAARLRRFGLLPPLRAFAGLFHAVANRLTWGEHRGGMYVKLTGRDQRGNPVTASWHLLAETDDGPFVPTMAADAIIRKCLAGNRPTPGARHAAAELQLDDFARAFAAKGIATGTRLQPDRREPLYGRILGAAWDRLPGEIRDLHQVETSRRFAGRAAVDRGRGIMARLIGALYRFPDEGAEIPVGVLLERRDDGEIWQRTFAGRTFRSIQNPGAGRSDLLIEERFGPVTVGLALVVQDAQLDYVVRRWRFLGIPMPLFMAPGGRTFEHVEDGRFRFHVEIGHPWFGLIVGYRGWLQPVDGA